MRVTNFQDLIDERTEDEERFDHEQYCSDCNGNDESYWHEFQERNKEKAP